MQDARRTLLDTAEDWNGCQKCNLSVRRDEFGAPILLGEGNPRGILFVGAGPGWPEEKTGRIFNDKACEKLFHPILSALRLSPMYMTYLVACRSCAPLLNDDGTERQMLDHLGRSRGVMHRDGPPNVPQIRACHDRLMDEIYQVDPFVIVALGKVVATTLLGSSVDMRAARGTPMEVYLPGAGSKVSLTKKGVWRRKVKGQWTAPTEPSKVRYIMVPTWSIAELSDRELEQGEDSALAQFVRDIKLARDIHRRAHEEMTGVTPHYYEDPVSIFDANAEED
jgi:uracil-DNA glycosylase